MIKRWIVSLPSPDGYSIKPFDILFYDPQEIVLAADHEAEIARLRDEGQKDYDGMREFQRKFIYASHKIERLREELDACGDRMRLADAEIERLRSELESTRDAIVVVAQGKDTKLERLRGAIKQLKTSAYLDDWETFDKVIREALGDDPV